MDTRGWWSSSSKALLAVLILLAVPAEARAQQPDLPSFKEEVRVRLVTIPVLARDLRGRPVTDLTSEEILVREGSREYQVAFISPFFDDSEERRNLPAVRLITQVPGGNREVASSTLREPRHLLILADLVNDPPTGRKQAIDDLIRFLESELDPSFRIAVMAYDGRLDLVLPFTQNRGVVADAIRQAFENPGNRPRVTPRLRMDQLLTKLEMCEIDEPDDSFDEDDSDRLTPLAAIPDMQCLRDTMNEYSGEVIPRAVDFVAVLENAIQYAAGIDGHTFILAVGGNVTLNPAREVAEAMRALFGPMDEIALLEQSLHSEDLVRPHMQRLMRFAFENNVSINFLDRSPMPSDLSVRQRRELQPGYRPQMTAYQIAQQGFDELATSTGGSFIASTDVHRGMQQSLDRMEGGYYVSFYVDHAEELDEDRLTGIELRSTRSGVSLKHRRAFEGVRRNERTEPHRIRGIIQVGMAEPEEFEGTRGYFVPLRLVLDPRDLGYEPQQDLVQAEFTVHVSLRTPKGMLLADSYNVLTHSYPRSVWNGGEIEPPELQIWADLPDGDYFAEAVITVPRTGSEGTIRRHIAVRGSADAAKSAAETADATIP